MSAATFHTVQKLVESRGIESDYLDAWGKPAKVSEASQQKLLAAMGYSIDDAEQLSAQVQDQLTRAWLTPLNPVLVLRQGQPCQVDLRLPLELVSDSHYLQLETEQGGQSKYDVVPGDGQLVNVAHIDDVEFHEYLLTLPAELPLGYHQLSLHAEDGDQLASMRVIVAPHACYQPEHIRAGNKVWGLSVQLYCLRSQHNWGIGDFSDLAYLVEKAAGQGAHFIGLNPIHALYPANPASCSPYGPSSRRWLNYLYLDVSKLDGYQSEPVQQLVGQSEFQQKLQALRDKTHVDYQGVSEMKLQALRAVFEQQYSQYLSKNTKRNKAFKAFVTEGGHSLQMLAVYDALQAHLAEQGKQCWGWPVFPKEYQSEQSPAVRRFAKKHAKTVKFYLYLQWQAALQLEAVQQQALEQGMCLGIYRDLAVGVSEGSAEIWGNKDLYCTDASVGAPPDVLGPLGQNWGLPPMDPDKLYQQQYQPIIDLFRANMQSAGALRIDHVMALLRLWWVYRGDDAKDGGYVYYPVDDLLAILALESHRQQALVIGEDLGTVPDEILSKLADNGIFSYRVFFFEQAEDGGFYSPAHYPIQSMSTLTTHDMPTLEGFWHCHDLELGKELGLYPSDEVLTELYHSRHFNKQQILDSLHGHAALPQEVSHKVEQVGMTQALNFAMQKHMASGSSALLSLQLEDWLQMDKPVNVPGTYMEYPNWQRKLTRNLDEIFNDANLQALATSLTHTRQQASQ